MESQPKRKVRGDMNKFDMMSKDAMNRMEEIMNSTRLNEFLHRKEEEDKKKKCDSLGTGYFRRSGGSGSNRLWSISFLYTGLSG